ncbi:hypothetical protein [Nitrosopumilus sp. b1]|nr:hypothetical protein [Nitrosopumilus sp. b1]
MKQIMQSKPEKAPRGAKSLDACSLGTQVPAWYDIAGASYLFLDDFA